MRGEFAGIGGQAEPLADAFDFRLKRIEFRRVADARPDGMRLLRSESAGSCQLQLEFRTFDPVQPVNDLVGGAVVDISDEAKSDVVILHIDPTGTGKTTTQQ